MPSVYYRSSVYTSVEGSLALLAPAKVSEAGIEWFATAGGRVAFAGLDLWQPIAPVCTHLRVPTPPVSVWCAHDTSVGVRVHLGGSEIILVRELHRWPVGFNIGRGIVGVQNIERGYLVSRGLIKRDGEVGGHSVGLGRGESRAALTLLTGGADCTLGDVFLLIADGTDLHVRNLRYVRKYGGECPECPQYLSGRRGPMKMATGDRCTIRQLAAERLMRPGSMGGRGLAKPLIALLVTRMSV